MRNSEYADERTAFSAYGTPTIMAGRACCEGEGERIVLLKSLRKRVRVKGSACQLSRPAKRKKMEFLENEKH